MKKIYLLGLLIVSSISFAQVFNATYDFSSILASSTQGSIDPTPPPTAPGMIFGSFSAINPSVTPPYNSTGLGRFSFVSQPTGATTGIDTYSTLTGVLDATIYFQIVVTPNSGTTYSLTGITFKSQRSGTGIRTFSVRSSDDNFAANLPASVTSTTASIQPGNIFFVTSDANTGTSNVSAVNTITLTNTNITAPTTFRFYGWNSEAATGSFSIDDVVISGNVSVLSTKQNAIAGLEIYPNPVSGSFLNIETATNGTKTVSIFDVLGKQVLSVTTDNATINVGALNAGVYIIKITEDSKTATRKLVVR